MERKVTDKEKVKKMFEIRKTECPDDPDAIDRVSKKLSPCFTAYWALLKMYNERFPGDKG